MFKNNYKKIILYMSAVMLIIIAGYFGADKDIVNVEATSYPEYLIAGGNVIGIKLYTDGVHVVDTDFVETIEGKKSPAVKAGIKSGDYITEINGKKISTIEEFVNTIKGPEKISITYVRKGKVKNTMIEPALSSNDNSYKIGIWVRDSTAGIGTVTFYNPETKEFGALGHSVNDSDTKKLLNLKSGKIYKTHLTSVTKSKDGHPGEINGTFVGENNYVGYLTKNTSNGIFGIMEKDISGGKKYKVATRDEVKTGEATILCSIDDDGVKEYKIEIINVIKSDAFKNEGMTIKLTDPVLLQKTDGILQGMSGSPIIQNDKLVGAITHVFINNPQKGFGIFIEDMILND